MKTFIQQFVLKYWPSYFVGFFALIITNYTATLIPANIQIAIDLLSEHNQFSPIKEVLIHIIYLATILIIARTSSRLLIFFPGRFIEYDIRNTLFAKLCWT